MAGSGWPPKHAMVVNYLKLALENAEASVLERILKVEKEFGEMKEVASRLREERDVLCKRLKEKEEDHKEIIELKRKNCELQIENLRAKTDADIYQKRIKELEGKVFIMNVEKDVTNSQTNSVITGKRARKHFAEQNANQIVRSSQKKRTEGDVQAANIPGDDAEEKVEKLLMELKEMKKKLEKEKQIGEEKLKNEEGLQKIRFLKYRTKFMREVKDEFKFVWTIAHEDRIVNIWPPEDSETCDVFPSPGEFLTPKIIAEKQPKHQSGPSSKGKSPASSYFLY